MSSAANPPSEQHFTLDKWRLYFHETNSNNWDASTYIFVADIFSLEQFWTVMAALGQDIISGTYLFLMRGDIPPRWEHYLNNKGGSYSMRISKDQAAEVWKLYSVDMVSENLATAPDIIQGISISPKKNHCVIKVWNKDSKVGKISKIPCLHPSVAKDGIHYTLHVDRSM